MEYNCTFEGCHWKGRIERLEVKGGLISARLSGRDSGIDIICGSDGIGGNFICLPDFSVGSRLAAFTDTFWNKERLTPLIGDVDAVTVAQGLKAIENSWRWRDEH